MFLLASLFLQAVPPGVTDPLTLPSGEGAATSKMQMLILVSTLITTIAGFVYNAWTQRQKSRDDREREERRIAEEERKDKLRIADEERKRKWDLEDRMHAREEAIKRMQLVHNKIDEVKSEAQTAVSHAENAVRKVEERSEHLATKIEENTEISRQAFKEGNNFNMKLSDALKRFEDNKVAVEVSKMTIRSVPTDEEHAGPPETAPSDS